MPYLEQGDLERVAAQAKKVAAEFRPLVDQGVPIIALTASCGLMMKFEWPLIVPENEDVIALSKAAMDIDEYLVDIAKTEGLATGLEPLPGGVTVHLACHARAQNMGPKAAELLKYIPQTEVDVVERCAGHGGTFGVMKETHDVAMKVGKTTMRTVVRKGRAHIASECPLAAKHLLQGIEEMADEGEQPEGPFHPVELLAKAYGL
jgi:glycerol-3-phosphate dehydrogenase subunit C